MELMWEVCEWEDTSKPKDPKIFWIEDVSTNSICDFYVKDVDGNFHSFENAKDNALRIVDAHNKSIKEA